MSVKNKPEPESCCTAVPPNRTFTLLMKLLLANVVPLKTRVPPPVIVPFRVKSPLMVKVRPALMVSERPASIVRLCIFALMFKTASFVTPEAGSSTSSNIFGVTEETQLLPFDQLAELAPAQTEGPLGTKTNAEP